MRSTLVSVAATFLASTTMAQVVITAPSGYATQEGEDFGIVLGAQFRNGRVQVGDPSMRGGITSLLDLAYRCDEKTNYLASNGMGRRFTSLSFSMGHTNCAKFSRTFTANMIGGLTNLYKGSISFPNLSGLCSKPTWGSAGRIKFTQPFTYDGRNDLLQDWTTAGGTFTNGYTGAGLSYYADGCYGSSSRVLTFYGGSPEAPGSKYLPEPPFAGTRCTDSSQTGSAADAYTYIYGQIYADNYPVTSLRNSMRVTSSRAFYLAKSAPYIAGVSIGGFDQGIPVLAHCNHQYVNLFFKLAIISGKTTSAGTTPNMLPIRPVPYINGYSGIQAFGQAAWTESKSGFLALSKAVKVVMPKKPDGTYRGCAPACVAYQYKDGAKTVGPFISTNTFYNVIERFTRK